MLRALLRLFGAALSVLIWKVRLTVRPCNPHVYESEGRRYLFCVRCGEYANEEAPR